MRTRGSESYEGFVFDFTIRQVKALNQETVRGNRYEGMAGDVGAEGERDRSERRAAACDIGDEFISDLSAL